MHKNTKNIFCFTAAVVAAGLLGAGCSDSDDNNSTPSAKLGSVVFEYSLQAAARTEIPNTVTSVKYSFRNAENSTVFFTKSYEVPHQSTKVDQASLTIREVPITAKTVVAAYYDKDNKIVNIGVNDLSWTSSYTAAVKNPEVTELKDVNIAGRSVNKNVIAKGQELKLDTMITLASTNKTYYVTDFATFKDGDKDINLKAIKSADDKSLEYNTTSGHYEANNYGKYNFVATLPVKGSDISFTFDPTFVSDNTIESISLQPVYATVSESEQANSCEVIVPDADLGASKVTKADYDTSIAVGKEQFKVLGVYTDDTSKGPQPESQDLTSKATLTCDYEKASVSGNTVTFSSLEASQTTRVKASVKLDGEAEAKTGSIDVKLIQGYANVILGIKDSKSNKYEDLNGAEFTTSSKLNDIRIIGNYLTKSGDLDSNICDYILLDENMIPKYPTPRIEPNHLSTSPYFDFGSDNRSYILEIGSSVKSGNYTLSVGTIDKLPGYNATTKISVK